VKDALARITCSISPWDKSVEMYIDLSNVLRSVMAGAGACDRWSTKDIAVSRTER
jgi:hypothetical protein